MGLTWGCALVMVALRLAHGESEIAGPSAVAVTFN